MVVIFAGLECRSFWLIRMFEESFGVMDALLLASVLMKIAHMCGRHCQHRS